MAAKATKTIKQALHYHPHHTAWFVETQVLFNCIVAFYFEEVIQAHPGVLERSNKEALTALERLTHATKENPHPLMPLSAVADNIPALFRRAAINAALGSARSFSTTLATWRKQKEKAAAKGKKFTTHPPVPPRAWNRSVTLYAGQWKERTPSAILLKLWTGSSWAWVKCRLQGRDIPDGWDMESAQVVRHGSGWWLHTPLEQALPRPAKVETQLTTHPETRLCAIDLNITKHLAVCSILTVEGTVVATRFIGGGKQLHGLRKRQLGRVARNRSKIGIMSEGEQDNAAVWAKIRALDEESAHQVSHRIVEFAQAHGATVLVFEHLGHFKPQKGKYSKRGNEKRSYWLRGKIFTYSRYKAWNSGILTCRVSPRNTSRQCARCGALVARYGAHKPAKGYTPGAPLVSCPQCQMRGHADRNAAIVIGKRLLARYQTSSQEKPHAPLPCAERPVKAGGDSGSQDAESSGRPSTDLARHGTGVEQGTAQGTSLGMAGDVSDIPRQLRMFDESSSYAAHTPTCAYSGVPEEAARLQSP